MRWLDAAELVQSYVEHVETAYMQRFAPRAGLACLACGREFGSDLALSKHRTRVHGGRVVRFADLAPRPRLADALAQGWAVEVPYGSPSELREVALAIREAARSAGVRVAVSVTGDGETGLVRASTATESRSGSRGGL